MLLQSLKRILNYFLGKEEPPVLMCPLCRKARPARKGENGQWELNYHTAEVSPGSLAVDGCRGKWDEQGITVTNPDHIRLAREKSEGFIIPCDA